MILASKLRAVFRNLIYKSRKDADEVAELQTYLDLLADELIASGMSRADAERSARIRCGGRAQLEQDLRDLRTGIQIVFLWQGFRYAVRQLLRQPLFTVAAVGSLALGMGATTAIFSAVYALTIRALPFQDSDRLVFLSQELRSGQKNAMFAPDFMAMRASGMHTFEQIAGFAERSNVNLTGGDLPERLRCVGITANFFATLGVHPQIGRDFLENDDRAGVAPLVLISDRLWQSHFGAHKELIGRSITIDGERRTLIGILPHGFVFPDPSIEPDVFLPANLPTSTDFDGGPVTPVSAIAKIRKGVTRTQATAEVRTFFTGRARLYPAGWVQPHSELESLQQHVTGNLRKPLLLLLACVVCVLMVTCANVASLQLARAALRTQELSIRRALGASRSRLIQQFLTENLVLASFASLFGLAIAWGSLAFMQHVGALTGRPIETAYGAPAFTGLFGKYGSALHISGAVLFFSFALPLLTTTLFGIIPAFRATKGWSQPRMHSDVRQVTAGYARRRVGHVLLAVEVGAAIALLSCAGLLFRSLSNIMSYQSGFDPSNTITANIRLTGNRYQSPAKLNHFSTELLSRLESVPGVEGAALTNVLPVESTAKVQFSLNGESDHSFNMEHFVAFITISPEYFRVTGTPLLRGRVFDAGDMSTSPRVMVVNRDLATRFFGGNALGERLYVHDLAATGPHFVAATIIGIAENVPHSGLLQPIEPEVFLPLTQFPQPDLEIAIRYRGSPDEFPAPIVQAVKDTDPLIPVTGLETMDERVAYRVMFRKAIMGLISAFAGLATIVSAIGVGGMFSYMVAQRTREMGIRLALGASRAHLVRIVLKETSTILNIGGLLGLLVSFVSNRAIATMLVGIGERDPMVIASALALMMIVALSAALMPAIRASRADVLTALREE